MRTGGQIERLPNLLTRFRTLDFVVIPAREFVREWGEAVKKEAEGRVSVFTGGTKDSFQIEIGPGKIPKYGQVYSDDPRARWLEYGTGALSEDPASSHQPYMPPISGVRDWADAKGLDPYTVALGIFRRGGTPPTHFMSDSIDNVNNRLNPMIGRFGRMIEQRGPAWP